MKTVHRIVLALLMGAVVFGVAGAQEVKLASVAPEASPYGSALNQLALDWRRISNGRVRLRVYHNGVAGTEEDVLRKMRIGQLQAAVLTSSGLRQVVPEVFSVSVPFMIDSDDELSYVMDAIRPDLNAEFQRNRLHVLAWSRAGWIHFFSRAPVTVPDDLKRQRLAADPADQELLEAFSVMGYRPIPIPLTELLTSLNSGLVDALYTSPLVAAGYQWFGIAPNMLDLKVAPFLGAIVITDAAWRRVPDSMKAELMAAVQRISDRIESDVGALEVEALETMQRFGLNVTELTASQRRMWEQDVLRHNDAMLELFDERMTLRIQGLLAELESR